MFKNFTAAKRIAASAALLLIVSSSPVLKAQNNNQKNDSLKTYNISGVTVTATRSTTPEVEVASSVTVLSEAEIKNSSKNSLIDLLRDVPGLSVARQGGPGTQARVFIRGANSNHTLVLVDGVSMNDPSAVDNSFDFTSLQTDNIERIEVLRGPQSTLYGSDALAGVISIFTKKGSGVPIIRLLTEGGYYDTYRANAAFNGQTGPFNYSLSYSRLNSKGFSAANEAYGNTEKDGVENNSFLSRFGIGINDFLSLDFNFNYLKSKTDLDQNFKNGDDPNFISKLEESVFRAAANAKLIGGLWQQTLAFSSLRHINHTIDAKDDVNKYSSVADFDGTKYKLEWQNNFFLNKNNTITFGLEHSVEKAATYYMSDQYGLFESHFPNVNSPSPSLYTNGAFIQEQFAYLGSIFGTLGIRYDKHEKFGSEFTYRLAPAFVINETGTKLKATFGTAFKSPSLYYLLDPAYGNPDLKPEKSKGYDIGFEQYMLSSKMVIGLSYFNNNFTDLIGYDKSFKTVNIDKAETMGIEFSLQAQPVENLTLNANYTYTESKDKSENKSDSGKDLIRRPKNKMSLIINYSIYNTNLNLDIINVGKRSDKDFSNSDPVTFAPLRVELSPYTLVNFAASYELNKYVSLFGRVENIFDAKYEEVLFYGTPGRSVYGGIKLSY